MPPAMRVACEEDVAHVVCREQVTIGSHKLSLPVPRLRNLKVEVAPM